MVRNNSRRGYVDIRRLQTRVDSGMMSTCLMPEAAESAYFCFLICSLSRSRCRNTSFCLAKKDSSRPFQLFRMVTVEAAAGERLVAAAPATVPVTQLAQDIGEPVGAGSTLGAEATILEAWMSGFVQLRTKPLPAAQTASSQPEAFALARWQARTRESVTNLRHEDPADGPACADAAHAARRHARPRRDG